MTFTLDIDPKLWARAETTATSDGTTVRDLVEEGLRRMIDERQADSEGAWAAGRSGPDEARFGGWMRARETIYGNED